MEVQNNIADQNGYSFVLKEIDIIEKSLNSFPRRDKSIEFDFDISLRIAPNLSQNQSFHIMTVGVLNKANRKKLAGVTIGFIFDIKDFKEIVTVHNQNLSLPPALVNLLNAVVIGTTRGIMFSEFRGTSLDNAILPVLDPSRFENHEPHQ